MSLKVLLLEDDESLARELEHALAQSAHEVTTVGDPEEGFGLAASRRFDVVFVSDDLSERLRSDPTTAGIPFVIMSKPVVVADLIASLELPAQKTPVSLVPSPSPSLPPSGDPRETIKNQARTVATLRVVETTAMDVAQAQIDLGEMTRARTADAQSHTVRLAELETALAARITELENALAVERATSEERFAAQEQQLGGTYTLEGELATAKAKVTELTRALEAAEREGIQQQLARDAAFHDMSVRAAAELDAAVRAAKAEANADREELLRAHEHAIKLARDKAIGQALAVARERKKQT